jgi:hypothetical protein
MLGGDKDKNDGECFPLLQMIRWDGKIMDGECFPSL